MEPIKTIPFKDGRQLEIIQDDNPESPRDWDNIGTMALFSRSVLGDQGHDLKTSDFGSFDEMGEWIEKKMDSAVVLPVYQYEHSGTTIATTPFSCHWDSGQIGFIFVSHAKVKEEYGDDPKAIERATAYLQGEVDVYDQFLRGDVYGFVLREPACGSCGGPGEIGDDMSIWGFYGDDPLENGMIDNFSEYREEIVASA